jgi:hypothetical protein
MEEHTVKSTPLFLEHFGCVESYGLSLAVRVGCEIDIVYVGRCRFQGTDYFLLALNRRIFCLESLIYRDTQLLYREILDVTYGGRYLKVRAEVFLQGPYFRW